MDQLADHQRSAHERKIEYDKEFSFPQRAGSLRARSNERNAARYDQARKSSSATTRIVSGNPDGARKRWTATMFTMTGASTVNASGTKRPVRSATAVIAYVPKSSGKKYPLATSPPMNSAAASLIVGSGNQLKTRSGRRRRDEAEKDAGKYDGFGSHG
jgi:hypothetical protein